MVGGIVGDGYGDLINCENYGIVNGTTVHIGGITGQSYTKVDNCKNYAVITGGYEVGGIAGRAKGSVTNCENHSNVEGKYKVGGICGYLEKVSVIPEIKNCINEGTIKSTGSESVTFYLIGRNESWNACELGGIVGLSNGGKIESCKNKGKVEAESESEYDVGGIVGIAKNDSTIKYCSNMTNIYVTNLGDVGGIVGYADKCTIEECYNSGNLTGNVAIGGIIGTMAYTTIKNCYNIGEISGDSLVGGIIGQGVPYEYAFGYVYMYNCINIGLITGTSYIDCWGGKADYITWDHLYTIKTIYDQVGEGTWNHTAGGQNYDAISAPAIGSRLLTKITQGDGADKWTRENTSLNSGYPYLVNNVPEE